jgi:uncharacterized protein (TIGR02996 family)
MTYDEAFLRSIVESPDDDTPRLVYADWLDDRGNPRGEFIRVQCRLARMTPDNALRPQLETRARELLDRHQDQWLGPLRPLLSRWVFRRGFLDVISVPAAAYLRHATLPHPPTVRRVEVDLDDFDAPPSAFELVPESVARENVVMPVGFRGRTLVLAMSRPRDVSMLQKLVFILNRDIEPVAAREEDVIEAISRHYGNAEVTSVDTCCFVDWSDDVEPGMGPGLDPGDDDSPVARLVTLIIAEAVSRRATRIHIEPRPEGVSVLYLIDGDWEVRDVPPRRLLGPMVARIRFLSGLAEDDPTVEQAGLLRATIQGRPVEVGVSIRPSPEGPSVLLSL